MIKRMFLDKPILGFPGKGELQHSNPVAHGLVVEPEARRLRQAKLAASPRWLN